MEVRRASLLEGAKTAEGVVVIIDVFRAFSVATYAAALGARPMVVVAEAGQAFEVRARHPAAILSGESGGWRLDGFDLGNSPTELLRAQANGLSLTGRPFVQRTSAGTQGVIHSRGARRVFVASFTNAHATAAVIRNLAPQRVTLVAMGRAGQEAAEEDEACGDALEALLAGRAWETGRGLSALLATSRVRDMLDGRHPFFPPSDVALCLAVNAFSFALAARRVAGPLEAAVLRPIWVAGAGT